MKCYRMTAAACAAICLLAGCTGCNENSASSPKPAQSETTAQTTLTTTAAAETTALTTPETTQTTTETTAAQIQKPSDSVYMDYYYHPEMPLEEAIDIACGVERAKVADSYFSYMRIVISVLMPSSTMKEITEIYNVICLNHVEKDLIRYRFDEPFRTMNQNLYDKKYKNMFGITYDEMLEKDDSDIGRIFADWAGSTDLHDVPLFLDEEYKIGLKTYYRDEDTFNKEWDKITDSLKNKNLNEMSALELLYYAQGVAADNNPDSSSSSYNYRDIPIEIGTPIVRRMEAAVQEETEGYPYWKQMDMGQKYTREDLNEITESNIEELIDVSSWKYAGYPIPMPKYYEQYKLKMKMKGIQVPDTVEEAYSLILPLESSFDKTYKDELYNREKDEYEWWNAADYVQNIPNVTEVRLFVYYEYEDNQKNPRALYACFVEGDGWIFFDKSV